LGCVHVVAQVERDQQLGEEVILQQATEELEHGPAALNRPS